MLYCVFTGNGVQWTKQKCSSFHPRRQKSQYFLLFLQVERGQWWRSCHWTLFTLAGDCLEQSFGHFFKHSMKKNEMKQREQRIDREPTWISRDPTWEPTGLWPLLNWLNKKEEWMIEYSVRKCNNMASNHDVKTGYGITQWYKLADGVQRGYV